MPIHVDKEKLLDIEAKKEKIKVDDILKKRFTESFSKMRDSTPSLVRAFLISYSVLSAYSPEDVVKCDIPEKDLSDLSFYLEKLDNTAYNDFYPMRKLLELAKKHRKSMEKIIYVSAKKFDLIAKKTKEIEVVD